jgi:hypothetical protein
LYPCCIPQYPSRKTPSRQPPHPPHINSRCVGKCASRGRNFTLRKRKKPRTDEARSNSQWRGPPRDSTAWIRSLRKRRETTRKQVRSRFKTLSQPRFAASPKPPAQSRARRRVDRSTPRAPRLLAFAPRSAPRRIASHARLRREIQPPASVRAFKSAIAACRDPRPARPPRGDTRSTREPPPVTRTPHTP